MIPMNIGFMIHRMGEWTMLMLGESIFSLVIVDVPNENRDFFSTFYCGILTVVLLCYLHFQSQPHDPDAHALRRSKDAGVLWSISQNIYSFALVCLGASFTFFLTYFANKGGDEEEHRSLAGASDSGYTDSATQQERSAHLFCGSLSIIFACLDFMTVLHIGYESADIKNVGVIGVIVLVLRLTVIPFTATVSQWETEPAKLSMIGLLCVLGQLFVRKLGNIFLGKGNSKEGIVANKAEDISGHPHHLRQSALMASAWSNMEESQLQALVEEESQDQIEKGEE